MNKRYWHLPKVSYDEVVRLFTVPKTKEQIYKDKLEMASFMGYMTSFANSREGEFLLTGRR